MTFTEKWERSRGGLWLPNMQLMSNRMGFCCCTASEWPSICGVFQNPTPDTVNITISGFSNSTCVCTGANTTYEDVPYISGGSDLEVCYRIYSFTTGGISFSATFTTDIVSEQLKLVVNVQFNPPGGAYPCSLWLALAAFDTGWIPATAPWPSPGTQEIDQTSYSDNLAGGDVCDPGLNATAVVTW